MKKKLIILVVVAVLVALAWKPVQFLIRVAQYENPAVSETQEDTTVTDVGATQAGDGRVVSPTWGALRPIAKTRAMSSSPGSSVRQRSVFGQSSVGLRLAQAAAAAA